MNRSFDIIKLPKSRPLTPSLAGQDILVKEKNDLSLRPKTKRHKVKLVFASAMIASAFAGAYFNYHQDFTTKAALVRLATNPGNYLIVFQNDAELRPSGGFIGSYATLSWDRGVKNLQFGTNIYKIDNPAANIRTIDPPKPFVDHLGVNNWGFRDSNWDLDFRSSARNMLWFYQTETGETEDGVIVINTQTIVDFLKLTGPIFLEDRNMTLDSSNFRQQIEYEVEKNYYNDASNKAVNEPKSILGDLMPIFIQKAYHGSHSDMYKFILDQLSQKNIMLYTNDASIESAISEFNWGGAIRQTDSDYLYINRANLGGGKSSKNVTENISYKIDSNSETNLIISRTHTGDGSWPDATNNTYYRIAVPNGAILEQALLDGANIMPQIDTSTDHNRTVFGFYVQLEPGKSQAITLNYQNPAKVDNDYSLLIQKQSGAPSETYNVVKNGDNLFGQALTGDKLIK